MANGADAPATWRSACLRLALRSYPAADRDAYGPDLLDAAIDLAAAPGGSLARELRGLAAGGLDARFARLRRGLRAIDRRATVASVVELLAALVAAVWGAAAIGRMTGSTGAPVGVTPGAMLLLAALAVLLLAVARRQRSLATTAASFVLAQVVLSAAWSQRRGDIVTAAPQVHLHLGRWYFGPSLAWALLPFVVLLVAACWSMKPAAARVPGLRRPMRESAWLRLLLLVLPAVGAGVILTAAPSLLLEREGGETTELPGLLFLMLIVTALWVATSSVQVGHAWSAAGAVIGLAASPSVAYGLAGVLAPGTSPIGSAPLRIGFSLGIAALTVLLLGAMFVAALARTGLRQREPGAAELPSVRSVTPQPANERYFPNRDISDSGRASRVRFAACVQPGPPRPTRTSTSISR